MAGRGFSFKQFAKTSVDKEASLGASGTEAKALAPSDSVDLKAAVPSPAPSTIGSSGVFLPTLGRGAIGRGLAFPKTVSPPKQDAATSSIISTVGRGRGIVGRGMFAMKTTAPIEVAEILQVQPITVGETKVQTSEPTTSGSDTSKLHSSGGIAGRGAAGRGIISSGRGTGSGEIIKTGAGSSGKGLRLLIVNLLSRTFNYFRPISSTRYTTEANSARLFHTNRRCC